MPLYIKDDTVDDLAIKFMKLSGASSKTDAVRTALKHQINLLEVNKPLLDRIRPSLKLVKSLGKPDPTFDQKQFSDDLYEGM